MPAIILPGRNTVNPAHPLSAGLVGAWTVTGKDAFPLTSGVGVLTGTNTTVAGTSLGIVHNFSSAYLQNTAQSAITGPPMTLAAWIWANRTSGADQRILTVSTGTTANDVFGIRLTSSFVGVQHYDGAADSGENYSSAGLSGQWVHVVGVVASLSDRRIYVNSTRGSAPYGGTQASPSGVDRVSVGYAPWGTEYFDGQIAYPMIWNRALSAEDVWLLYRDTERLVRTGRRVYFFPSAAGGAITGSGTPAAQSATVAGTATRTITGSGTPSAQAATAAGTAEREITGSGAPVSQYATVAGTGSVSAGISGSGVLSAQSATVAGTATRTVTASGTPSAQSATVAGTAEREVTGSGTPSAQSATVVGTGQIGNIVTGSGAPAAQSATVAGTAEREITSSGAVSAQSATVAGAGVRVITGTGSPTAQDATVYGYDVAPQTAHNTGGGGSRKMLLSERKVRDEVDEWLKKKREQEMLARIQREDEELVLILALVA